MKEDGCRVKICGITLSEDGNWYIGLGRLFRVIIDVPYSPRRLSIEAAADCLKMPFPG